MTPHTLTPIDFNPFEQENTIVKIVLTNEPQREIWLSCTIGGEASNLGYNESISLAFYGAFNADYFLEAIQEVIKRHESLRSTISGNGESLIIYDDISLNYSITDFSDLSDQQLAMQQFLSKQMLNPFDLMKGPLLRFFVHKLAENRYHFTIITHHIICDGWSLGIILEDLSKIYNAKIKQQPSGLSPAPQISEYAEEMIAFQKSPKYKSITHYWLDLYKKDIPVLNLPTDRPRPHTRTYHAKRLDYSLSGGLIDQLKKLGAKSGCTLANTLLSSFEIFLFLKTNQQDIVVGLPSAGQSATENLGLVGHCVNLLPIRSKIDPDLAFTEYLKIRKKAFFDAQDNQQLTFGELIRKLNIQRDSSRIPLVPVMFNFDLGMESNLHFEQLSYKLISNPRAYEIFEIFLNVRDDKRALVLEWSYNTNLFNTETIRKMAGDFHTLIKELIESQDILIKDLTSIAPNHSQLIFEMESALISNNNSVLYKKEAVLPQTYKEKLLARLWTDALGLKDTIYLHDNFFDLGGHSLTAVQVLLNLEKETGKRLPMTSLFNHSTINEFVELLNFDEKDIQTNLLQDQEIGYNNLEEILEGHPPLDTANDKLHLNSETTFVELFNNVSIQYPQNPAISFQGRTIHYKELNDLSNQFARTLIAQGVKSGDIIGLALDRTPELIISLLGIMKSGAAYIPLDPQYPKDRLVFMLENSAAKMLITSTKYSGKFGETSEILLEDLWIQLPKYSYQYPEVSASYEDLAYVLYTSGSTGMPKGVQIEHRSLLNFLQSMKSAPGMDATDVMLALTTISFDIAGLELYLPLICGAKIVLASTEDRLDTRRLFELIEKENVSVMQATPATWRMMLSDNWEKKYPIKALCGGESLPKDLAEKLLQRCNSLWNLYGPTETTIWSTIKQITGSDGVITIGLPIANTVVYILSEDLAELPVDTPGEIYIGGDGVARGYLNRPDLTRERFIDNPIDSSNHTKIYRTGDLGQLLPNGEIICLGRVDNQVKIRGYRIELGEIEHHLNKMNDIKEAVVIAREDIPGDQRLVAYLIPKDPNKAGTIINTGQNVDRERVINWKKELRDHLPPYMFPNDWVELPAFPLTPNLKIDRKLLPSPPKLNVEKERVYNLSDVQIVPAIEPQIEIWLAYLMGQDNASRAYNLPVGVEFKGVLNRSALQQALQQVVNRHELLRSNFGKNDTQIHIHKHIPAALGYEDLSNLTQQEQISSVDNLYRLNAETAFDLFQAPLFRATLIKLDHDKHNFLFTVHHSAADGWSLGIIFNELASLYSSIINQQEATLKEAPLFSKYSREQQAFYKSAAYQEVEKFWVNQYKNNIPTLELPTDFSRPKKRSFKGTRIYYSLDGELFKKFKNVGTTSGCSPSISFRAALEVFLYRITGQHELVTGMPLAGQLGTDFEEMVAHCVNLLPLKATIDHKISFVEYLKNRKKYLLEAFEHRDLTFSSLLKKLNLHREESRVPLVSVIMNYDYRQDEIGFQGLTPRYLPTQKLYENFDISINVEESESDFKLRWDYSTDLYTEATISELNEAFTLLLKTVSEQPDIEIGGILSGEIQCLKRIDQLAKLLEHRIELEGIEHEKQMIIDDSSSRPLNGISENIIARIWSETLKIDDLKPTDDFFDLGGHSLIAVKVMVAIEKEIGKRLPLASLFENSTLEKLAKLIESEEKETKGDLLVPIKKTGTKTPIYMIHGGGLNVLVFNPLGRYMDNEQPVYALQALGLNQKTKLLYTMEELADRYNAEILKNDPVGPYALAGYSFGGLLAYEMAKKLIAMGKEVKMVGILDTYAGGRDASHTNLYKIQKKILRQFKKLIFFGRSFLKEPKETLDYQKIVIGRMISHLFYREDPVKDEAATYEDKLTNSYRTAYNNYFMTPLDIKIDLFRVKKRLYFLDDPDQLGWKDYALKGVQIHEVPGDHRTFLFPPNDKEFAEILQKALDKK